MSAPPTRKRLTARKTASTENITKSQQAEKDKPEIAKIGSKSEVVISGRRLLCKICRCVPSRVCLVSLIVGLIGVLLRAGENSRRRNTLSRTTSVKVSKPLRRTVGT